MRFMVLVKATKDSEAGVMPSEQLLTEMGKFNEKCASLHEAIEWVKRCPNPMPGESEIEIRQVFEADDFGAEFTPELREQEERLRAQIEQAKSR
jgi:hypothetical protein